MEQITAEATISNVTGNCLKENWDYFYQQYNKDMYYNIHGTTFLNHVITKYTVLHLNIMAAILDSQKALEVVT